MELCFSRSRQANVHEPCNHRRTVYSERLAEQISSFAAVMFADALYEANKTLKQVLATFNSMLVGYTLI